MNTLFSGMNEPFSMRIARLRRDEEPGLRVGITTTTHLNSAITSALSGWAAKSRTTRSRKLHVGIVSHESRIRKIELTFTSLEKQLDRRLCC